jgi:hypothetical protein
VLGACIGDVPALVLCTLPPRDIADVAGEPALGPVAAEKNAVMIGCFEAGDASAMLLRSEGLYAAKFRNCFF